MHLGGFQLCGERTEKTSTVFIKNPTEGPGSQLLFSSRVLLWDTHEYDATTSIAVSCDIDEIITALKHCYLHQVGDKARYKETDVFAVWVIGVLHPIPPAILQFGEKVDGVWTYKEPPGSDKDEEESQCPLAPHEIAVPEDLEGKLY